MKRHLRSRMGKRVKNPRKRAAGGKKFQKVMGEFGHHTLHSGSKRGPVVTNPKQAVAIAFSEQRRAAAATRRGKRSAVARPKRGRR